MKIKEKWVSWEELSDLIAGVGLLPSFYPYGLVGGLTAGSIPFASATGFLAEDNPNLFWDETNARLGLNQVVPTARIDIVAEAAFPGINISAGAAGEMSTPDGEEFRWGHWNEVDTFTERLKFDAAGLFYVSYLSASSIVFAGAGGEIKQDNVNLRWDDANNRLGVGCTPAVILDVEGAGETEGGTSYGGVVARFRTTDDKHVTVSIEANTGKDPVLSFAENVVCIWDLRNDASATDEFQIRYQVAEVNRTDFIIDNAGNVTIPTGTLTLLNEALHLLDTGGDHDLIIKPGEDLGADRILTLVMGDAARTITLSGNPTLGDWFDQAVKQASSPSFAGVYIKSNGELRFYDNGNYVGFEAPALGADQIWVLPAIDGAAGEALVTDGGGNLSFVAVGTGDVTAAAVLADHTLIRGDGGAKGIQDSGINIDDADNITLPDGASFNLQEDITFLGATTENKILIPDNLPDALSFMEGANFYMTFVTTNGSERIYILKDIATDRWLNSDLNVFLGVRAGGAGTLAHTAGNEGWHNIAIGYDALRAITKGYMNVAVGTDCLRAITTGFYNVGLGYASLWKNDTGYQNMAIGGNALLNNEGGFQNVAVGYGAMQNNVVGAYNVAIGPGALAKNLSSGNVGIGQNAGGENANGWANVCIGYEAGRLATVPYLNTYVGQQAAWNQFGNNNVAIGYRAMYNGGGSAGNFNACVGVFAGYSMTTAHNNVTLGFEAGTSITTGDGNVCIGYRAGKTNLTTDSNELWIANTDTATPLIYGEFPNALLKVQATNFNVIGTCNLGDGGVTNYANIATDGTVTLVGTARVIKRVFLNNAAFTKGGTAPVQVILGFLNGWEFDIGDDAVMTSMVPDDWDTTTDLTIKVCWYIDEAYAADKEIQWRVDWSAIPHDFSETVDAPTHTGNISSGDIDIPAVAKRMGTSTVGIIAAASLAAGDMLGFKLSRIAVTEDNPTAKPTAHHLMIEYTSNKIGT